ncbi:hypothetical protein COT65_00235 [Candidatus Shapirobacteria bacterium CG09_land_8_20_14_0_10_47_13]|uniref:inosine/xanthosine triphosphatase n=1 Tax=Candidatus Shapirobacteria bacterium CG09_land_8_20_14_0_10_47_13 TaxID=1974481 RepID=A0A2H0WNK0_9BACT|nr:MAG: hypothetical protein COT65_00235 [Candidatus Shapirobacteria bacterium CG09_land_8_20_14_0_10_47_13]
MKIVVGSTGQHKTAAVRQAFRKLFPKFSTEIVEAKTASDVAEQPVGNREILKGARNRARQCKYLYKKADWCLGIENGLIKAGGKWFDVAWVVVINKDWQEAIAPSAGVPFQKEHTVKIVREDLLAEAMKIAIAQLLD